MKFTKSFASATPLFSFCAFAAPTTYVTNSTMELQSYVSIQVSGWTQPTFPEIYHTCNETNSRMLNSAFQDSLEATAYSKSRLLEYGADDAIYKKWFGNGSIYEVLGMMGNLVEASKYGVLLRCDDIDGLCAENPNFYAGHHREDAPMETVICDYFYSSKRPLSTICFDGSIAEVGPQHYAGIDMLHRYMHVPTLNANGHIGEYAEEVEDMLLLAQNNATFAVRNTDNYLYYIAEVYSSSVIPGGCMGDL